MTHYDTLLVQATRIAETVNRTPKWEPFTLCDGLHAFVATSGIPLMMIIDCMQRHATVIRRDRDGQVIARVDIDRKRGDVIATYWDEWRRVTGRETRREIVVRAPPPVQAPVLVSA